MTQTSNSIKIIAFIVTIAVICGLFAAAVILNTQSEEFAAAEGDKIITCRSEALR